MKKYFFILLIINLNLGALLYPEDNSTINQIHIRFEWEQVAGNSDYALYVSENPNNISGDCIVCEESISGSLIHIEKTFLEWNKTYYWQVIDSEGGVLGSASFNTGTQIANATTNLYNNDISVDTQLLKNKFHFQFYFQN